MLRVQVNYARTAKINSDRSSGGRELNNRDGVLPRLRQQGMVNWQKLGVSFCSFRLEIDVDVTNSIDLAWKVN